jgi:hypothetical protein
MKSIWYTYRIKVRAEKGTLALQEALAALVEDGEIEAHEFVRAAPAKEEKA